MKTPLCALARTTSACRGAGSSSPPHTVKITIWTLLLPLALTSTAMAMPTDEEKCQKKKLIALGKRDLCLQKERSKEVIGKTPDTAQCAEKLAKALTKADEAAAKKGASWT